MGWSIRSQNKPFIYRSKTLHTIPKEKYQEKHRTAARTRPRDLQMLGPDFFKREHIKLLFNSNGILTVHNLHSYHSLLSISKKLKFHTPIALHTLFTMSRRRGSLIITSNYSESSSFVYNISRLWNTFRTTPEGNEINDFNVSLSFIKNQIILFVCKRQNLSVVNEWNPEITICIMSMPTDFILVKYPFLIIKFIYYGIMALL